MASAIHTTLLTQIINITAGQFEISFIHRTAGTVPAGSGTREANEGYTVRVRRTSGDQTFHGASYTADRKIEALADYNRRIGTYITIAA